MPTDWEEGPCQGLCMHFPDFEGHEVPLPALAQDHQDSHSIPYMEEER